MNKSFKRARLFLLLFTLSLFHSFTSFAQQVPQLPLDTAIHTGILPNGLTYYVRYNAKPEKMANFYIAQRVGSLQEEENQRGLAHFLEHMAFNGSKHFPENGIIEYCRSIGVKFGADINAYTAIDRTVYNIDNVPMHRTATLDSCLLILSDWSHDLTLADKEIDKERGVIHGEWAMRDNAQQRIMTDMFPAIFSGSRWGSRMPIGLMSVVDNFDYKALRDYYHKWYRPDNQAIIVVGDIDVEHTITTIKRLFSDVKVAADAAKVTKVTVPDNTQPIYYVGKDKELPSNNICIAVKSEPLEDNLRNTVVAYQNNFAKMMIASMLNARLSELAQQADCPYLGAQASIGGFMGANTKEAFSLGIAPKEGKDLEAMTFVVKEAMRARQHGFTSGEYERVKANYLSSLERGYGERNNRKSKEMCEELVRVYLEQEPSPGADADYQIGQMVAEQISLDIVNNFAKEVISFADSNLVVFEMAQDKPVRQAQDKLNVLVPDTAQLRTTLEAARLLQTEAWVDNVTTDPLIAQLPAPGKIKKQKENKTFGSRELLLSNGAKVVLKHTDFKENEVMMSAVAEGGSALYGESDYANLAVLGDINAISGLGGFTTTDLRKMLAGKQCGISFSMGLQQSHVSGSSTPKDLETFMQLVYLQFTAQTADQQMYERMISQYREQLPNRLMEPQAVFSDSLTYRLYCHNPRFAPLTVESLNSISYNRCLDIIRERLSNAADYTFTFVGNYDEKVLLPLIEQYIASLPGLPTSVRKQGKQNTSLPSQEKGQLAGVGRGWGRGERLDVRTFFTGAQQCSFQHKMETPRPQLANIYYSKIKNTVENDILCDLLSGVFTMEMLRQVREEASASYSCGAGCKLNLSGPEPMVILQSSAPISDVSKLDMAADLMKKIVTDAASEINPDVLQKVKDGMLKDVDINAKSNGYWMGILTTWQQHHLDFLTGYKEKIAAVTPQRLSQFLRDNILKSGNHLEVIMRP